ncbi:MAG: class I SAM-dependent rRNA methyltransferase [Myxococcota bacterium]|nr:class I SAM-dependent rRNA methyltransferase [Myxococcota bacterium]
MDEPIRTMTDVIISSGRERSLRRQHPWLLSGAVASEPGEAHAGAWVRVVSKGGEVLGYGHYSPKSSIRVRLLAFGKEDPGEQLLEQRLEAALARRREHPLLRETDAMRLVNAEGDGLPGLVVDRLGDVVVLKFLTAGMHARADRIAQKIQALVDAPHGYRRRDDSSARREGIPPDEGTLWGSPPSEGLIEEAGRRYAVDFMHGQKTGFYLDQRDARQLVMGLAAGRRTLDVFSYTGSFAVAAGVGGAASLVLVDSSEAALRIAESNLEMNGLTCPVEIRRSDAFEALRSASAASEKFDLIVLDPPPLARSRRAVQAASRAYKDMLLHGLRCAAPSAFIVVFTCSHHVDPDLFQKIVFGAALDAGRGVRWLRTLGAPADHPFSVHHPEGRYLHGCLLEVEAGAEQSA